MWSTVTLYKLFANFITCKALWAVLNCFPNSLSLSFISLYHIRSIHHITLKINCFVSIIHLLEHLIAFNSFQLPITVLLCHFCRVIQEMDVDSSSSKQGKFLSQNFLSGKFLGERSFLEISYICRKLTKISLVENSLRF